MDAADTIRSAATLMRQRAEAATAGPWRVEPDGAGTVWVQTTMAPIACAGDEADPSVTADAEHIASWHPAVALAVAAWMDSLGRAFAGMQAEPHPDGAVAQALRIARTYLGEAATPVEKPTTP